MIKNCFKIARRSLIKSKGHSFINITGLSIGMAIAILIGVRMYNELSLADGYKYCLMASSASIV